MKARAAAIVLVGVALAGFRPAAAQPEWWQILRPTKGPARAFGSHARGCLAGAVPMPPDGPGYQLMRLSRGRTYGHPRLVAYVKRLGMEARSHGWHGVLVGDLAQARGGPMRSGHHSHQTGLDVDIWFRPAPAKTLSREEREHLEAPSVVAADGRTLDPTRWTETHVRLLEATARHRAVDRVFVTAAIKRQLCATVGGDRAWLRKIRPWWGHDDHVHVRLRCPESDSGCVSDAALPEGDGCDTSLDWWFSEEALERRKKAEEPPRPITLDDLPRACRGVLQGC